MIMPLLVEVFIAIGRLVFTTIAKFFYIIIRTESKHAPIIAEIILVTATVVSLVIELTVIIGQNHLRSDIWARNFVKSAIPNLSFMIIVFVIVQIYIVNSLKKTSADINPKKHKILMKIYNPEMEILMVIYLKENKTNLSFRNLENLKRNKNKSNY